jgi:glycosyltransferase involved in cell wall biosynthesis
VPSRLCYIAYPTSLDLKAANAIQTYTTCRELKRQAPETLILVPRLPFQRSAFGQVGATHLLRLPVSKASRFVRSTVWSYLERTIFAFEAVAYLMLLRLLAGQRYDTIYVRDVICAFWLVSVFGRSRSTKVIYEAHDLEQRNPSRAKGRLLQRALRYLDRRTLSGASAVVSLTAAFRDYLIERHLQRPERVFVIADAFDEEIYHPLGQAHCRDRLAIDPEDYIIAYSGLTFRYRSLDLLLGALPKIIESVPRAKLFFVGGRESEIAELRQEAKRLGLGDDRVIFTGQFGPDKVLLYLNAANVLTIPGTVTDVTASPLKMFEYMAVGKPIVCTDLPALREILDVDSAVFFDLGDVESLTEALLKVASSPKLAEKIARGASRKAVEHTYARRAERILKVARSWASIDERGTEIA